jgi:CHAT domain-containing protein/Tfp pilus assembly protein PilF
VKRLIFLSIFFSPVILSAQTPALYDEVRLLHDKNEHEACAKLEPTLLQLVNGRTDTLAANIFYYLANANLNLDSVSKAISFFEREKSIREGLLPEGEASYSAVLYNLTYTYLQANEYAKGKAVGYQLIGFDKKLYGIASDEYLNSLLNYVTILSDAGETEEAERELERFIKEVPAFALKYGELTGKLADVCSYSGKYIKSERFFFTALEILEESEGKESEIYNVTLSNYASLLMHQGKYDLAEELLDQVLEISKEKEWFTSETYYATLNNLALVHLSLGQYAASEAAYKKLMSVDSATIGPLHPDFSITLSNLGLLYIDEGKYREAEEILKQSLNILKYNKDTHSISYAKKINNLAKVYQRTGRYQEAIELLQQSLQLFETGFGKQSPEYATALFNLGVAYLSLKSPKALETLKTSLDIRGKIFGKAHPLYAECEEKIAQYHWMKKNKKEAVDSYRGVFNNYFNQIDTYFPVLTEEEKANFFYNRVKPTIESFATLCASERGNPALSAQLYDYHTNTKGLILFATEKVRDGILKSGDSLLIEQYEKWENAKDILTYYYSIHESQHAIDSVILAAADIEKTLTRQSKLFAREIIRAKISWKSVQQKLKPGEAALECLRYRVFNPDSSKFSNKIAYAFLLLTPEMKEGPVLINLLNGNEIETRFLKYYRNEIRLKVDDLYTYKFFWEPIQDELLKRKITRVYFSPDGAYNVININTLKNPFTNKYLIEEIDIRLVTSTRSLLETSSAERKNSTGYLFGFPHYNVPPRDTDKPAQPATLTTMGTRSFRGSMQRFLRNGSAIPPLPGTKIEVEQIAISLKEYVDSIYVNVGEQALESELKAVSSPALVHIATHGYFLEDTESKPGGHASNPLMMSGLILAGAENFIKTGKNPVHASDDGVLTAYEAMNLNLSDSKLVVLSACETGLGEIHPGEGVYGLQRAFQVAGAEAIIMSLWSVDDNATQLLMRLFYTGYLQTGNLYEAFRNAQQELKEKYPEPFYWGAFILVGKGS